MARKYTKKSSKKSSGLLTKKQMAAYKHLMSGGSLEEE